TQLPIPATAEIAIEGEIPPPEVESRTEGRFGEATGYYGEASMQPVIKVKAIHHRNDPIIQGNPPLPRISHVFSVPLITVPNILNELELAGVPDVKGVWNLEVGGAGGWMTIVSIKQRYGGHAMQAGLVAGGCHGGAYSQKYVVVVDDDIDPTNMKEVLWAIASRTDPITSINFLRDSWSTRLEPIIHPDRKAKNDLTTSKAIIIACKPYHWIDKFPPTNQVSPELREQVIEKWRKLGIIEW
ncbi:MAG: UbiD family decarboxylase domain-containing protein, partial [Candidatus Hodarchaeota archaeon]